MSIRKKMLTGLIISLLGFCSGYLLSNSYELGFCFSNFQTNTFDVSCHHLYERIGNPLFYGMSALSLVFLILALIPQAFSAWKKFAKWFIPIATLIFIFYPQPGSGDLFSPYPEQVFKWASIFYIVISVIIIASNRKS
jgi:hypothetical protein